MLKHDVSADKNGRASVSRLSSLYSIFCPKGKLHNTVSIGLVRVLNSLDSPELHFLILGEVAGGIL